MIRTFDSETERFLSALQASQARSSQALAQISTGLKVTRPSDAPSDVADIIRWDARLSRAGQVGANLSTARTEADTADTTLQTAIGLLENALQIGSQGTAVMQDAASRAGLAGQVRQLHQQMLNLTQLNVQGRYIFSGDHDQQAQYALDPTNTQTGVARLFDTAETRQVMDLIGGGFQAALTAEEIFDHRNADGTIAGDNAFAALTSLAQALAADDADAVTDAIATVKQSLDHLNLSLSFYGGVSNRITSSAAMVERYQLQWRESLSEKRDADLIQAATDLQASRTQQEAAMAARAKFSGRSLFDFL